MTSADLSALKFQNENSLRPNEQPQNVIVPSVLVESERLRLCEPAASASQNQLHLDFVLTQY